MNEELYRQLSVKTTLFHAPVCTIVDIRYHVLIQNLRMSFCFLQRESEILFFLLIVVVIRTKKAGSVTMINYLTSSFMYNKVANLILWFYADIRLGIIYGILVICK